MSEVTLENLGITKEDVMEKVVDSICKRLLGTNEYDEEVGCYLDVDSKFKMQLNQKIQDEIKERFDKFAEQHIGPLLAEKIESMVLQVTNKWGEKKGEPVSLTEYIMERAESYLQEEVNYNGKTKQQEGYGFRAASTRLLHEIDNHLHYSISSALKEIINDGNKQLAESLRKACGFQLDEIKKNLKIDIKNK